MPHRRSVIYVLRRRSRTRVGRGFTCCEHLPELPSTQGWVEAVTSLGMPCYPKTTGSKGIHVYVPIVRGPTQKDVWTIAKTISVSLAGAHPRLLTAEYRVARRPTERVLVDYNQNAWGRTLASVYSVRPRPRATVSTPVTWEEVTRGFCHSSVPQLIAACRAFIARINRDPIALIDRLWPKFELDPEFEEKLRVST